MKNYVQVFGNLLQLPLPEAPIQPRSHLAASLQFHIAANFQRAVAKEMRMLQQSNAIPHGDAEPSLDNLLELQHRNEAKDQEACVNMQLQDVLRGPGHVAWKLIQELKEDRTNDFEFNDKFLLSLCTYGRWNKLGEII